MNSAGILALAALFAGRFVAGASDELALELTLPERVDADRPFAATLTVTNAGETGFYFKRPWKWASNGLLLRAVAESGEIVDSATLLYDIDVSDRCTFFKPIGPGESFSFRVVLGEGEYLPELRFPKPGRYRVTWIYDPRHYEDEVSCAAGGWSIWKGRAQSPEVGVVVE